MQIVNVISAEGVAYTKSNIDIKNNIDALLKLQEVLGYCNDIHEDIIINGDIWCQPISDEGELLSTWMFSDRSADLRDLIDYYIEVFAKCSKKKIKDSNDNNVEKIDIITKKGEWCDYGKYLDKRYVILNNTTIPNDYLYMAKTSFPKLLFSLETNEGVKKIDLKDEGVRTAYSQGLKAISDYADTIYCGCGKDIVRSTKTMTSTIGIKCVPDVNHMNSLTFHFENDYKDSDNRKSLCCHIHLKLIRNDSDHRIYFWWNDEELWEENRIPIGYIDGHPY